MPATPATNNTIARSPMKVIPIVDLCSDAGRARGPHAWGPAPSVRSLLAAALAVGAEVQGRLGLRLREAFLHGRQDRLHRMLRDLGLQVSLDLAGREAELAQDLVELLFGGIDGGVA